MDNISVDLVRDLIEVQQKTTVQALEAIVDTLRANGVQNFRGLSVRSLERFMAKHEISRRLNDDALDDLVGEAVQVLGGYTGAKMASGYMRSQFGQSVGRNRVSRSLRRVDPAAAAARHHVANRLINPQVYHGRYFGYNLHMDQNEKLVMCGVTLVMAMDGFSGMVVGAAVMTNKNNIIIYEKVYRRLVSKYGLWKRVIVDHGKEFFLTLYMHMLLHHEMGYAEEDDMESTYKQTKSTRNNRIERLWVGVNQQVVYPIKSCIANMVRRNILDASEDFHMFSVGEVIRPLVRLGLKVWIDMWNNHIVPKRGRPMDFVQDSQTLPITHALLLTGDEAADRYRNDGGSLSDERDAPGDLLAPYADACDRRNRLYWDEELPLLKQRVLTGQLGLMPQAFIDTFENRSIMEMLLGATNNRMLRPLQEAIRLHVRLSVEVYNDVINQL